MKAIFSNRGSIVWFIVTAVLLTVLIVANILATSIFCTLMNTVMPDGGEHPVYAGGAAMELTFLEDSGYFADADKIDAAIWMGFPGTSGALALGRILNGTVNPSGRTVDTYASNLKLAPSLPECRRQQLRRHGAQRQ